MYKAYIVFFSAQATDILHRPTTEADLITVRILLHPGAPGGKKGRVNT